MKAGIEKLALLLAASGLSEREIARSLCWIEKYGADAAMKLIVDLRHFSRDYLSRVDIDLVERNYPGSYFGRPKFQEKSDVIEQVEHLLRTEADLSAREAADVLLRRLSNVAPPGATLPEFRTKDGFSNWLDRIASKVPSSVLLQHATKIRNEVLHTAHSHWPLKQRPPSDS